MNLANDPVLALFVESIGSGSPIVLIHGGASSHNYWQKLAPLLSHSHQVIMPDLLGMGQSPKPDSIEYSLQDHVSAIEQALDSLGIVGSYRLLGHSLGAIVAVGLAKKQPERVERLVLSAPIFYTSRSSAKHFFGKAVAVPNWLMFGPIAWTSCQIFCRTKIIPRLVARVMFRALPKAATDSAPEHTWASFSRTRDNLILNQTSLTDLASLRMPVQVAIGVEDPSMEPAAAAQIAAMPNIDLRRLPSGHNLPYSQTQFIADLIMA